MLQIDVFSPTLIGKMKIVDMVTAEDLLATLNAEGLLVVRGEEILEPKDNLHDGDEIAVVPKAGLID